MMWIHPVLQTLAALLSLYVLYLGWVRFRFAHLGHKGIVFQWKRHVAQGTAVMTVWALAFVIGLGAAWNNWHVIGITELHYQLGLVMLPMIIFGLGTGVVMDRVKAKRRLLPLAHGVVNALLVLMALCQLYTGVIIIRDMLLA
ncbi:MAG: DUF4079 domain-containing protein [Desulfovibrio sp.]|nr:DUF4079 domain-containing protein [Desulfovibrio sp.]